MHVQDAVIMADVGEIYDAVDEYIKRTNPSKDFVGHFSAWGKELGDVIKNELGIVNSVEALALGLVTEKTELGPIGRNKFFQFLRWLEDQGFEIS